MANLNDPTKKIVSLAGIVADKARTSSILYSSMLKYGSSLLVVLEVPSLNVALDEEAFNCEKYFVEQGLIFKFNRFGRG